MGVTRVLKGERRMAEAAASLGLSERQLWRLRVAFERDGWLAWCTATAAESRRGDTTRHLGVDLDVASLADIIRSKEAAGREKDRIVLPVLRRLLNATRDEST